MPGVGSMINNLTGTTGSDVDVNAFTTTPVACCEIRRQPRFFAPLHG